MPPTRVLWFLAGFAAIIAICPEASAQSQYPQTYTGQATQTGQFTCSSAERDAYRSAYARISGGSYSNPYYDAYSRYCRWIYDQNHPMPRGLLVRVGSAQLMGGVAAGTAVEDGVRSAFTAIGGPVFYFAASEPGTGPLFSFVPEVGYSFYYDQETTSYSLAHFVNLGAHIGFVVREAYLEQIFGLDLFARLLVGADDRRFAVGLHTGVIVALINHLFIVELGYQLLARFDGRAGHSFLITGGLDLVRCIMSFIRDD